MLRYVLPLALLLVSCSEPSDGERSPFGSDAPVYGEWDVNGQVPDADVCERAGIDRIEVAFFSADDTQEFTSETFRSDCAPGFLQPLGDVLRAGTYGYRWRAYEGGTKVLESMRYAATVRAGHELELMAVDFLRRINVRLDVSLSWAEGAGYGDCAASFVDTMSWELRKGTVSLPGTFVASSNGYVACANSFSIADLPVGTLAEGAHVLTIHGSASDASTWSYDCVVTIFESGVSSVSCQVPRE